MILHLSLYASICEKADFRVMFSIFVQSIIFPLEHLLYTRHNPSSVLRKPYIYIYIYISIHMCIYIYIYICVYYKKRANRSPAPAPWLKSFMPLKDVHVTQVLSHICIHIYIYIIHKYIYIYMYTYMYTYM